MRRSPSSAVIDEIQGPSSKSRFEQVFNRIPPWLRRYIANVLIFGPIVAIVWLHFPFQIMNTNGGSMSPFLNPGHQHGRGEEPERMDRLLVSRLHSWFRKREMKLERGDVIVFKSPIHYNGGEERVAVKRVVGVPGDRVQPLAGWEGEENEVVVPFNHFWVEGDVEDRSKSMDSNWYGPISQALVVGKVWWLMEPWWSWKRLVPSEQDWPAKRKARVEEGVVQEAMVNPDQADDDTGWIDGRAEMELKLWQTDRERLVEMAKDVESRWRLQRFYQKAKTELEREDERTSGIARDMMEELQLAFKEAGIGGGSTPSTKKQDNQQQME